MKDTNTPVTLEVVSVGLTDVKISKGTPLEPNEYIERVGEADELVLIDEVLYKALRKIYQSTKTKKYYSAPIKLEKYTGEVTGKKVEKSVKEVDLLTKYTKEICPKCKEHSTYKALDRGFVEIDVNDKTTFALDF